MIEVGSGNWSWTAEYTDPDARGPYTVDDLIGEILFATGAREAIVGVLQAIDAPPFLRHVILNQRSAPLRQALGMLSHSDTAIEKMNAALADLPVS